LKNNKSILLIVAISLITAALHLLAGPGYTGPFRPFVTGYLIDLVLPMNLYLLLQVGGRKHFSINTTRIGAAVFTFGFGVLVETLQHFKIDFLGRTYDPWDLLMYAAGVCLGLAIDLRILEPLEKEAGKNQ